MSATHAKPFHPIKLFVYLPIRGAYEANGRIILQTICILLQRHRTFYYTRIVWDGYVYSLAVIVAVQK